MVVLIVLLIVFSLVLVVQSISRRVINIRVAGSIAIAAMFFFTGVSHFTLAESMVLMLPEWVPLRYLTVLRMKFSQYYTNAIKNEANLQLGVRCNKIGALCNCQQRFGPLGYFL